MSEDEVIHHPVYGRGIVRATRHKRFELFTVFEDGRPPRWVRRDDLLTPIVSHDQRIIHPVDPRRSTREEESFKARRMIEAFRLGVVPQDCVDDFTFGRDEENRIINEWLALPDDPTLLIVGEYGTGKSHLLQYAYGKALRRGFAVASIAMDPSETPFSKPKRVYSRLIRSFRCPAGQPGQTMGFRQFLEETFNRQEFQRHKYFRHIAGKGDDGRLWDWIEASEASIRPSYDYGRYWYLPKLYDYGTAANIYCNLLSSLGWAARELFGLEGLLLIFDEAETVDMRNYYYPYQIEQSMNFLRALLRTAENEDLLLEDPSWTGLTYCRVSDASNTPFLYRIPSGLKLLFAFTSLSWNEVRTWDRVGYEPKILELDCASSMKLESLSEDAQRDVVDHICLIYDAAYKYLPENTEHELYNLLAAKTGRTRHFVKGCVEALDLLRFGNRQCLDDLSIWGRESE